MLPRYRGHLSSNIGRIRIKKGEVSECPEIALKKKKTSHSRGSYQDAMFLQRNFG